MANGIDTLSTTTFDETLASSELPVLVELLGRVVRAVPGHRPHPRGGRGRAR